MIELLIEARPQPKARPRFWKGRVWSPVSDFEKECKIAAQEVNVEPLEGPVRVDLEFRFKRPASKYNLGVPHVSRSDLDNLIKAVCDACNTILYVDDKQIVEIHAKKVYAVSWGCSVKVSSL